MRIASNGDIVRLVRAGALRPVGHHTTQVNGQERVTVSFEVVGDGTSVAASFVSPFNDPAAHNVEGEAR